MSKFGNSIGVWEIGIDGTEFELKPTMNHVRLFRNIVVSDKNRKDKAVLFQKFADFMHSMIVEAYAEESKDEIREWVELYVQKLFELAMIAFRWTSKEEMEKSKSEVLNETKNLMSDD